MQLPSWLNRCSLSLARLPHRHHAGPSLPSRLHRALGVHGHGILHATGSLVRSIGVHAPLGCVYVPFALILATAAPQRGPVHASSSPRSVAAGAASAVPSRGPALTPSGSGELDASAMTSLIMGSLTTGLDPSSPGGADPSGSTGLDPPLIDTSRPAIPAVEVPEPASFWLLLIPGVLVAVLARSSRRLNGPRRSSLN